MTMRRQFIPFATALALLCGTTAGFAEDVLVEVQFYHIESADVSVDVENSLPAPSESEVESRVYKSLVVTIEGQDDRPLLEVDQDGVARVRISPGGDLKMIFSPDGLPQQVMKDQDFTMTTSKSQIVVGEESGAVTFFVEDGGLYSIQLKPAGVMYADNEDDIYTELSNQVQSTDKVSDEDGRTTHFLTLPTPGDSGYALGKKLEDGLLVLVLRQKDGAGTDTGE